MKSGKLAIIPPTSHTNDAQRLLILNWLQVKENFALITGSAAQGQRVLTGKKLKKQDAYKQLAAHVSAGSNIKWDAKQAKNRFEAYLGKYKKAKKQSEGTGWGVTEEDRSEGINTVEEKLNNICPHFESMNDLFGERQNISPEDVREAVVISDFEDDDDEVNDFVQVPVTPKQKNTAPLSDIDSKTSNSTKKKRDFSSLYAESSAAQLELNKATFEFNKMMKEQELELQKEKLKFDQLKMEREVRANLIQTLIEKGKSAEEINQYLSILNQ